jgi:hypothetical protein
VTRTHLFANEKVVFAPAVASLAAPTRAEITAGVVLVNPGVYQDDGLVSMTGFETAPAFIDVPDAATDTTPRIPGRKGSVDASLTFYETNTGTSPNRTALAEATSGYVIRMPYGDVATRRCEVWPVTTGAVNTSQLDNGNDAGTFTVNVAVTAPPNKNAVIPA